jgi:hypothetical protein
VFAGGQLYEAYGMSGTLTMVAGCGAAAAVAITVSRTP